MWHLAQVKRNKSSMTTSKTTFCSEVGQREPEWTWCQIIFVASRNSSFSHRNSEARLGLLLARLRRTRRMCWQKRRWRWRRKWRWWWRRVAITGCYGALQTGNSELRIYDRLRGRRGRDGRQHDQVQKRRHTTTTDAHLWMEKYWIDSCVEAVFLTCLKAMQRKRALLRVSTAERIRELRVFLCEQKNQLRAITKFRIYSSFWLFCYRDGFATKNIKPRIQRLFFCIET